MIKLDLKNWQDAFKWQYEAYPIFTSVYVNASHTKPKNKYYVDWADFINKFEGGHLLAFKPNKQILRIGNVAIKESLAGNDGYFQEVKKVHREIDKAIGLCLKARKRESNLLSSWWPQTQKALSHAANILFSFDYTFDGFLRDYQQKNPKNFEILNAHIQNSRPSFLDEARKHLLELDRKYAKNFDKTYNDFVREFGWFQNTYKGAFQIGKEWLKNYLKEVRKQNYKTHSIKKNNKPLPKKYKIIVELANDIIIFRDNKKKLLLLAVDLIDNWLEKKCVENNWKYESMRWLTIDEILEINQKNKTNITLAEKCNKDNSRLGLMTHTGYQKIDKNFWLKILSLYESVGDEKKVKGIAASGGVCRGRVKIIFDAKKEAYKLDNGDVLVTSMTRPEFLPLMNKACAFITDEGGISCHAAIVAREMKKPCIIATKNATRVLKDNDFIEVDADKGMIKILY